MGDFNTLAKHMWKQSVEDEIWESVSILAWLKEGQKLDVSGQDMKEAFYNDDQQDLVYSYGDDTIVVASEIDDKVVGTWQWKAARLDLAVSERKMLLSKNMMEVKIDYVKDRLARSQVSFRRYLNRKLLGLDGTTTDGSEDFQGLRDALTHDLTYGARTRDQASSTNDSFQGGSLNGDFDDQATEYPASITTVRNMLDVVQEYEPKLQDLLLIVGRGPFRELQGQVEGSVVYQPGKTLKYGCPNYSIDGVRVIMDYHLAEKYATGASRWAYMLNRGTWTFRLHPERNFSQTPFKMVDDRPGGKPIGMSTIKIMGNCWCSQPNANIWVPVFGS